eukprot:scaffold147338_cov40-Prasinocladus_malaysianus.AAC.1
MAQVRSILSRDSLAVSDEGVAFKALVAWRDHDKEARTAAYVEMLRDPEVVRLSQLDGKIISDLDNDELINSVPETRKVVKDEFHRRVLNNPPTSKPRGSEDELVQSRKKFLKQKVKKQFSDGKMYGGKIAEVEMEEGTGKKATKPKPAKSPAAKASSAKKQKK